MTIARRYFRLSALVCGLAACSSPFEMGSGIGGRYTLSTVDAQALPCCTHADSTGTRVTIVSGTLTLDETLPQRFVATPAGWYPASCVGTNPGRCGDAAYTLTLTQRFDNADGSSRTTSTTSTGLYAWSSHDPAMVKLVDASMGGDIVSSGDGITVLLQHLNVMGASGPTYSYRK